jgi:uncharacterized membrane protein
MSLDREDEIRRHSKRQQFSGASAQRRNRIGPWVACAVAAAILLGIGAWLWGRDSSGGPRAAAPTPAMPVAVAENGAFRIPLADLASGQAKFFEHRPAGAQPIRFFAIKSGDGTHRAALDACEICYAGRRGYEQNGNEMLCRKCGRSFPSEVIDDVSGGCHPIRVERAVEGDTLVVRVADAEEADAPHAAAASSGRSPMPMPPTRQPMGTR